MGNNGRRDSITEKEFLHELERYRKGSITRRHFLGVTGLGTAMMAMGGAGLLARPAFAAGAHFSIATWDTYIDAVHFDEFEKATGVHVTAEAFSSNDEMFFELQAHPRKWDLLVATNYAVSTYAALDLIQEIDISRIPNFNPATTDKRFIAASSHEDKFYAVPKNWGTTGYIVNTNFTRDNMTSWREFWDGAVNEYSGRTMVHNYQLTVIGNALKYFGYSFNSNDPKELDDAEKLLIEAKPHLLAVTSDTQPHMRSGRAWMSMCWNGDAVQLHRDIPSMQYILATEGGEIWADSYVISKNSEHLEAVYAFIDYMQDPLVNATEHASHGYPIMDSRAIDLLSDEVKNDPIYYPSSELLNRLEFAASLTLTNPHRTEIMARFRAA